MNIDNINIDCRRLLQSTQFNIKENTGWQLSRQISSLRLQSLVRTFSLPKKYIIMANPSVLQKT